MSIIFRDISTQNLFLILICTVKNTLRINRKFFTSKCVLIPFGSPSNPVSIAGLKWNLRTLITVIFSNIQLWSSDCFSKVKVWSSDNQRIEYGNLIIAFNEVSDDEIQIDTNTVLHHRGLWKRSGTTENLSEILRFGKFLCNLQKNKNFVYLFHRLAPPFAINEKQLEHRIKPEI